MVPLAVFILTTTHQNRNWFNNEFMGYDNIDLKVSK